MYGYRHVWQCRAPLKQIQHTTRCNRHAQAVGYLRLLQVHVHQYDRLIWLAGYTESQIHCCQCFSASWSRRGYSQNFPLLCSH